MPANVVILTLGSRGDVQPYVALGKGLLAAGHRVRLVAPGIFAGLAGEHGLAFTPLTFNPQAELQKPHIRALLSQSPLRFLLNIGKLVRYAQQWYRQVFEEFLQAARGADVIVCSTVACGADECAETLGVPLIASHLAPLSPTRAFSNPFFGGFRPLGPLNRASHLLMEQVSWQSVRAAVNRWRVEALGLPRLGPLDTTFARARASGQPVLYAYSPTLVPKPPDWGAKEVVTGYWFLDSLPAYQPPPGLVRFLQEGPPPLCVGFGSMSEERPEQIARLIREAVALAGQRAVVLAGWAGLSSGQPDEQIYWADALPHDWLFPQVAAVLHHGGAGTTGAVLRAGVPSLIAPFLLDQFGWAELVHRRGVGLTLPKVARLTAERLAAAIRDATGDGGMRQRAAALGADVRRERGVERALDALGGLLA